jgi:hypothetical protein
MEGSVYVQNNLFSKESPRKEPRGITILSYFPVWAKIALMVCYVFQVDSRKDNTISNLFGNERQGST